MPGDWGITSMPATTMLYVLKAMTMMEQAHVMPSMSLAPLLRVWSRRTKVLMPNICNSHESEYNQ
jgi:hypothetical protein